MHVCMHLGCPKQSRSCAGGRFDQGWGSGFIAARDAGVYLAHLKLLLLASQVQALRVVVIDPDPRCRCLHANGLNTTTGQVNQGIVVSQAASPCLTFSATTL